MKTNESLPYKLMVLISLIQGLSLLYLHQAIELDYWPHDLPQWLFAFYSVAFIWPTMLLLSLQPGNMAAIVKITLPFALLGGVLGYYMGYQATPVDHVRYTGLLAGYVVTMAVATFKALMYSQQLAAGERITYSALFLWSWRNFLTLALALLFAGCFWLILMLWGGLFAAIDIDFFRRLFGEPWFYYPAIALANGFGIIIFRRLTPVIDTITRLQQALMKFLLILLVLVSFLFLAALPFTGLGPLWESGGSGLILWMQALMLFFVNAVYQDHPEQRPYPLALHRFVYAGVALLPVYSAIAFYGLSLRVGQYGWSLDRCWAFLVWFLLALFPLGYWWGIFRRRDGWVHQLSRVNVAVGLVVLATMLLVNSPLLDFRKIVVNDQMQRLADNRVAVDDFDIVYFRRSLARPGYDALQRIKEQYGEEHPGLVVRINELYRDPREKQPVTTKEEFIAAIEVLAGDPPAELLDTLYNDETANTWRLRSIRNYYLRPLDLNDDGEPEYLFVVEHESLLSFGLYYSDGNQWQSASLNSLSLVRGGAVDSILKALKAGDITIVRPDWNKFVIGDETFQVRESGR